MRKKVVIVTGGRRGIGSATARLAAARGYAVCINYLHNRQVADSVAAGIVQSGGEAIAVANVILWLLSDEASYTTGSFVDVAGGR